MLKNWPLSLLLVAAGMMSLGTSATAADGNLPQLKLPSAMNGSGTISLLPADPEESTDTDLVWFRRRYGYRSYYRSYSYYPRYYSSFRYSYYPRYYSSFRYSYYPRYYSSYSYYPRSSFGFSYSYYPGGGCYYGISYEPCQSALILACPTVDLVEPQFVPKPPQQDTPKPMPPAQDGNNSFKYDGDPAKPQPLPTPKPVDPAEKPEAQPRVPLEGRAVSLPAPQEESPFRFRAYGEKPQTTKFAEARTVLTGSR